MQQKTETKTQRSDKAVRILAHLGIWLQNRHWSGQPSLLYTRICTEQEKTVRTVVIQQVYTTVTQPALEEVRRGLQWEQQRECLTKSDV